MGVFEDKYKNLNAKQKEAVDTIFGPVMVIAGPGTGKTTVLTLRIANILKQTDAKPDEILALTFTESGAKAMREKLREIIGDASFRVNIFTFHGFANHMRAQYPECFEKIGGRVPASESDQIEVIENILANNSFKELRVSTYGVNVRGIAKRITDLKRENIDPKKLVKLISKEEMEFENWQKGIEKMNKTREAEIERKEKYLTRLKELADTYEQYEVALEENSLYDFEDTILGLIDALSKHTDMLSEMRENFQFVMADEHQDANGAQNEILRFFRDEESPDQPNMFVVGDDKQSIFRFQGASLENFYNFESQFPNAKRIDLSENYRSHQTILDSAHALISNDGQIHTQLKAGDRKEDKKIEVNEFDAMEEELQGVARSIEKVLKESGAETVAVLARNNSILFELGKYLDVLPVSYSLAGEQSLFEMFEYKRLSALFEALVDPLTSPKLIESVFFGYFSIDLHDVLQMEEIARRNRTSFGQVFLGKKIILDNIADEKSVENARKLVRELSVEARKQPLLNFLKSLKEKLNLTPETSSFDMLRIIFAEAEKLVLKKRSACLPDLVEYLNRLERHNISPAVSTNEKKARVTLSSIHRSKGLEYDMVFILDVTDKRFEKNGKKNDLLRIPGIGIERDLDEERRLLYVAITRAKKHVAISYSLKGLRDESLVPSQFIDEMDERLLDKKSVSVVEVIDIFGQSAVISADAKEDLREAFLKRSFSVTALNNFLECPWKYFFRNLLLIPDIYEWSAMLGTACHSALEEFHRRVKAGKTPTKLELTKIVGDCVRRQAFSENELKLALSKATENVLAYQESFEGFKDDKKVLIEESLSFPSSVPHESGDFEIMLTGKIDLALETEDGIEVIDFKSKKRISRNEILGETKSGDGRYIRQLQFYKYLWENSRQGELVNKASIVFLTPERGKVSKESFEVTEADKFEIENTVKDTLASIYNFDFLDKKCENKDCDYCAKATSMNL